MLIHEEGFEGENYTFLFLKKKEGKNCNKKKGAKFTSTFFTHCIYLSLYYAGSFVSAHHYTIACFNSNRSSSIPVDQISSRRFIKVAPEHGIWDG
jgi:hypothetical protein